MCRLFGLSANRPVDLEFSFVTGNKTFPQFAKCNPDGFGVGWFEKGAPWIDKEPCRADESPRLPKLASGRSKLWIGHVRQSSRGKNSIQNCHPFCCDEWMFAHNGTVEEHKNLQKRLDSDRRARIEGETDSEVYFHWLLQNIQIEGHVAAGVRRAVSEIPDYSSLNFVLTDGDSLFAYRNPSTRVNDYSLHYLERAPGQPGPDRLKSDEFGLLMKSKALRNERALLVCSEPLTTEAWKPIPLEHLLAVDSNLKVTVEKI